MTGLHIGTCGWAYAHWIGPFYPPGCRSSRLLEWYAQRFDSVELDATFYGLPKPATLAAWRDSTPEGFIFSCKASRYLTHYKKLLHPEPALGRRRTWTPPATISGSARSSPTATSAA